MIHIAIIENNPAHLKKLKAHVQQMQGYKVIATATDGFEFIKYCYQNNQHPDIALIDVEMPKYDGVALTDFLSQHFPNIKAIAVTSHSHIEVIEDMFACGAMGIVYKVFTSISEETLLKIWNMKTLFDHLEKGLNSVRENSSYIDPFFDVIKDKKTPKPDRNKMISKREEERIANQSFELNPREELIAALFGAGDIKVEEIAELLSLSNKSIELHLTHLYEKMNVRNRAEFTRFCISKAIVKNARNIVGKEPR